MWAISERVRDRIVSRFSGDARAFYEEEFSFINEVCDISGKLYPFTKAERKDQIGVELRKIEIRSDRLYIPFDPSARIVGVQVCALAVNDNALHVSSSQSLHPCPRL